MPANTLTLGSYDITWTRDSGKFTATGPKGGRYELGAELLVPGAAQGVRYYPLLAYVQGAPKLMPVIMRETSSGTGRTARYAYTVAKEVEVDALFGDGAFIKFQNDAAQNDGRFDTSGTHVALRNLVGAPKSEKVLEDDLEVGSEFFLRRNGMFACSLTGENHCGFKKVNSFKYDVEICINGNSLDERGFVVDNAIIGEYFDKIVTTDLSCERLARKTVADMLNEYFPGGKRASVKLFRVKIWGTDQAHIEFVWINPRYNG